MPQTKPAKSQVKLWRVGIVSSLIACAIFVLATHWHTVASGIALARTAKVSWLAVSLLLMSATFCIAAAIYGVLAFHPLRYRQTLLVEVSAAFVNRLLPSGFGSLGLHGVYLHKRKHTVAEATVVVSVNNLVGMTAHVLLLSGTVLLRPLVIRELFHGHDIIFPWQDGVVLIAAAAVAFCMPLLRSKLLGFGQNMLASLLQLRFAVLLRALLLAMLLTATYTSILYASVAALGLQLSLLQVFIVFSIGMLTSTVTPTPGGLVGAEAGLFAGFVAYGVSVSGAAAGIVLFRLVTYWLPLILGACAFVFARQQQTV